MKELHAEIEIQATAERVWQLLTDFERFPQWNPFIRQVKGQAKVGAKLEAHIQNAPQSTETSQNNGLRLQKSIAAVSDKQEIKR